MQKMLEFYFDSQVSYNILMEPQLVRIGTTILQFSELYLILNVPVRLIKATIFFEDASSTSAEAGQAAGK